MKVNPLKTDWKRLEELKGQVIEEEKAAYHRRLEKNCEDIKRNGKFSNTGFWNVQRKMEKKKSEAAHAVRDGEGKIVTETDKILKAYEKFYEDLLT